MHAKTQAILLISVLSAFATYIALSLISASITVPNSATLKTIGLEVYWDEECSNLVNFINWGSLEPGQTEAKQVYIKNTGNTDATLSFTTENWSPVSASNYITLEWNYDGSEVPPNYVVPITFTLHVSSSIQDIDSFVFDLVITGTA